ncbi:type II secretion system F family protein [Auraticoccus monumenti]|uniref:Tight adherence protein C n=1 Tax=Auraticoccus monumenti TaxID=675864 RepID=A0A1G6YCH9_9ACTN|nr:type II secretion system F family protein [Auraticoccus monumenti]SDD87437.1 tight adherence protein C [Auraticoccus monumenti]
MPPLVLAAAAATSLSLGLLAWTLLAGPDRRRQLALASLQRGRPTPAEDAGAGGAGGAAQPDGRVRLARRLTPAGTLARLERLLSRAGRPAAWPLERVIVVKLGLPVASAVLWLLALGASPSLLLVLLAVVVTVVCWFVPDLLLHSRGQERSQQITLELADTLDQMTIAVEAGLGFDSAMARAGRNGKGPLAEELVRTLQDVQMGRSRREAYQALAARTDAPDLRRFIRAVIQADAYGVSIADVLRTQAAEMRMKRRQRAEEKAMQIPVKVIFPLMLCILPVLFIVLLGPAALSMVAAFR